MNDAIKVKGLDVRYGRKRVLNGLDLCVPTGSVTGLLGENGAGKSTLLRVLAAEMRAKSGEAALLGIDPRRHPQKLKRSIGWVPDRVELPRWMTIADHMRFLAPFYPTWDAAEEARLLELFGLDRSTRISNLSKGQRALEALVAALAHRPKLLLLDEPFSGLDPVSRRRVFDGVLDHLREDGTSVLVVSHSIGDLERCCDRIAILSGGKISVCEDIEAMRKRAARVSVTVDPDFSDWTPPGAPFIEQSGEEWVLFYLDWSEALRESLEGDTSVSAMSLMPRDLEDVLVATVETAKASS